MSDRVEAVRGRDILLRVIVAAVATGIVLGLAFPERTDDAPWPLREAMINFLLYAFLFTLLLHLTMRRGAKLNELFGSRPSRFTVKWSLLCGVALIGVSLLLLSLLLVPLSFLIPEIVDLALFEMPPILWTSGDNHFTASFLSVFTVVLLGPVTEELIFRGMLLPMWAERIGERSAIILNSLLFAVLHVDLLGAFLFGVITSLAFLRTRSLWAPVLIHVANNVIATLLEAWQKAALAGGSYGLEQFQRDWISPLVGAAVGIPLLIYVFRKLPTLTVK